MQDIVFNIMDYKLLVTSIFLIGIIGGFTIAKEISKKLIK